MQPSTDVNTQIRNQSWDEAMSAFMDRIVQPIDEHGKHPAQGKGIGYPEPTVECLVAAIQSMWEDRPPLVVRAVMARLNNSPIGQQRLGDTQQ